MATTNMTTSNVTLSAETAETIYTTMRRIRAFEEKTTTLFEQGAVKGTAHSYIGEEAVAAAAVVGGSRRAAGGRGRRAGQQSIADSFSSSAASSKKPPARKR